MGPAAGVSTAGKAKVKSPMWATLSYQEGRLPAGRPPHEVKEKEQSLEWEDLLVGYDVNIPDNISELQLFVLRSEDNDADLSEAWWGRSWMWRCFLNHEELL